MSILFKVIKPLSEVLSNLTIFLLEVLPSMYISPPLVASKTLILPLISKISEGDEFDGPKPSLPTISKVILIPPPVVNCISLPTDPIITWFSRFVTVLALSKKEILDELASDSKTAVRIVLVPDFMCSLERGSVVPMPTSPPIRYESPLDFNTTLFT